MFVTLDTVIHVYLVTFFDLHLNANQITEKVKIFKFKKKILIEKWKSRQLEVAVNYSYLFFLSIYNSFINISYIIIVISLQRSVLCKFKFIDENNITYIKFSSCYSY